VLLNKMVEEYRYDPVEELWCEVTFAVKIESPKIDPKSVVEAEIGRAVVHEVPGIKRCFTAPDPKMDGRLRLKTEGVNIAVSLALFL
jgi:hypothetical protein